MDSKSLGAVLRTGTPRTVEYVSLASEQLSAPEPT
jgi:hypothetical protein